MVNQLINLLNYLLFFGIDIVLFLSATYLYVKITGTNELELMRGGNVSASIALTGTMIGFAFVVYTATQHGSWIGTILWSILALVVQIAAYQVLRMLIHDDWKKQIDSDNIAHGIALGTFSLAIGILNAGCIT